MGCMPLRLDVACEPGVLDLRGRVWFIPFRIRRRRDSGAESGGKKAARVLRRGSSDWKSLRILLKNGYTTLGRLVSRMGVKRLKLSFTAASSDPANTAMLYSAAGLLLENLSAVCAGRVPHADLQVDVDFAGDRPRYLGQLSLRIRLYQALEAAARFGWSMMRDHKATKRGV